MTSEHPLADYDTQIADLRIQIEPLQTRLSAIAKERSEYADLLAEETSDPQTLIMLREHSRVAHTKFGTHVRETTHEAIWTFAEWMPVEDDYSTGWLLGPHLSIKALADAEYLIALRDSMVDFADRFCNPAPELVEWHIGTCAGVDLSGLIFTDVLASDYSESHNFCIWYSPDGERAYLFDNYRLGDIDAEGTLLQVLAKAAQVAHNGR